MLQVNSWIHRGAEDRRTTLQTHDDVTKHRFKPKIKRIYSILFYFFSIDYFFVTVRSCCIETSRRWRQKLLQHRRRRRQNKTTWSKVSDVLNNGENRTRRRPARFISSAEAGTADSSLRQNLFRKVYFTHISDVFSFSLCCNVSETRRERQLDRFCSRPAQIIDPE